MKRPLWWPHLNVWELKFGRSIPDLPADLPPPHQSSIDALNTVMPNLADLPQICWQIYPLAIEHRCLEYHYTKLGRSTPQLSIDALNTITPNLVDLPPQLSINALHTATLTLADLIFGRSTPQSSIDALNTITPNLADFIFCRSLPPIEDRCLAYCCTELGRSTPPFKHRWWEYKYTGSLWHIVLRNMLILFHHFTDAHSISHMQLKCSFPIVIIFYCCQLATDHLQDYTELTIYHLYVSRGHLQYCAAQPISVEFHKICTTKLQ